MLPHEKCLVSGLQRSAEETIRLWDGSTPSGDNINMMVDSSRCDDLSVGVFGAYTFQGCPGQQQHRSRYRSQTQAVIVADDSAEPHGPFMRYVKDRGGSPWLNLSQRLTLTSLAGKREMNSAVMLASRLSSHIQIRLQMLHMYPWNGFSFKLFYSVNFRHILSKGCVTMSLQNTGLRCFHLTGEMGLISAATLLDVTNLHTRHI